MIKDYRIKLYDSKNGHSKENLKIDHFFKSQNIKLFVINAKAKIEQKLIIMNFINVSNAI